jgi:hypothetical protein
MTRASHLYLDQSTKHIELLVRAALKSVFGLFSLADCEQVIFSTTKFQPTARRLEVWLVFFWSVFVFGHVVGLALPAPQYRLVGPHALPLPFLPTESEPAAISSLLNHSTTAPPAAPSVTD